jgi:hypothetical protein
MKHSGKQLAVAATAIMGIAVTAPAAVSAPRPAQPVADGMRHEVVSECYWKKVCVRWSGPAHHPWCVEWAQKKACGPPIGGSKAPPSTPPKIKKRL